ncbi:MAG: hypothetical protein IJ007_03660 [Oscillospiraceae bacterium]|nr:hypothetical protein [Oscillospiraceae bacterium]
MKKSLIILLSILTLTACARETEKVMTETSAVTSTAVTTAETTIESISVTEEITSAEKITEAIIEESPQPAFKDNYDITDEELLKKFDEAYALYISEQVYYKNENKIFLTKKGETAEQVRQKYLNYFTEDYMKNYYNIYGKYFEANSSDECKTIRFWVHPGEELDYQINHNGYSIDDFIKCDIEAVDHSAEYAEYDMMVIGGCFDTLITVYDTEEIIKREDNKIILTKTVLHCTPEQGNGTAYEVIDGKPVIQGVHEKDENGEFYIAETELTGTIDESITADTRPYYINSYDYVLIFDEERSQLRFDNFYQWTRG